MVDEILMVCECSSAPLRADTVDLRPPVHRHKRRLTFRNSNLAQLHQRRVEAMAEEVGIVFDMRHHQMEDEHVAVQNIPNQLHLQCVSIQTVADELRTHIVRLRRAVSDPRRVQKRVLHRLDPCNPVERALTPQRITIKSSQLFYDVSGCFPFRHLRLSTRHK